MRSNHRLTPGVSRLEGRLLPAASPYPDAARTALHDSYVAEAEQGPTNVVFLGDSITYLWGDAHRPSLGTASWQADFESLGAENFGVIGDQTQDLLGRVQDGELAGQPKVAVVLIGINDLLGGKSVDQTAQGIASVVAGIRSESPNTDVLLLGILPTASASLNGEIAQMNRQIAGLGGTPGVEFIDPGQQFLGAGDVDKAGILALGVHPGAEGYEILAGAIDGSVRSMLDPKVVTAPAPTQPAQIPSLSITPPTPDVLIPIVVTTSGPIATASPAAAHKVAPDPSVSPAL